MGISSVKKIVLCADDFALNPGISNGIIDLVRLGKISAVSCMVNMPLWDSHAQWLKPYAEQIDIGLHFNLTEGQPINCHPFSKEKLFPRWYQLAWRSHFRLISVENIAIELRAQLQKFQNVFGKAPDFIDGHQHVHQLPVIREAFLKIYQETFVQQKPYVRIPANDFKKIMSNPSFRSKNLAIYFNGAVTFKQHLQQHHIPHNSSFAGAYQFSKSKAYSDFFPQFLQQVNNNGLIMCHPANEGSRLNEYQYFVSNEFTEHCLQHQIEITRFNKN